MFLIVAEVMNAMVKQELELGKVLGIELLGEGKQQVIAQYMDDTSLTLRGEKGSFKKLIYTVDTFYLSSELVLN
jgi:hypothetical protein